MGFHIHLLLSSWQFSEKSMPEFKDKISTSVGSHQTCIYAKWVYLAIHIRLTIGCHRNIYSLTPQGNSELQFSQFPSHLLISLHHTKPAPLPCASETRKTQIDYNDKNLHFLFATIFGTYLLKSSFINSELVSPPFLEGGVEKLNVLDGILCPVTFQAQNTSHECMLSSVMLGPDSSHLDYSQGKKNHFLKIGWQEQKEPNEPICFNSRWKT